MRGEQTERAEHDQNAGVLADTAATRSAGRNTRLLRGRRDRDVFRQRLLEDRFVRDHLDRNVDAERQILEEDHVGHAVDDESIARRQEMTGLLLVLGVFALGERCRDGVVTKAVLRHEIGRQVRDDHLGVEHETDSRFGIERRRQAGRMAADLGSPELVANLGFALLHAGRRVITHVGNLPKSTTVPCGGILTICRSYFEASSTQTERLTLHNCFHELFKYQKIYTFCVKKIRRRKIYCGQCKRATKMNSA